MLHVCTVVPQTVNHVRIVDRARITLVDRGMVCLKILGRAWIVDRVHCTRPVILVYFDTYCYYTNYYQVSPLFFFSCGVQNVCWTLCMRNSHGEVDRFEKIKDRAPIQDQGQGWLKNCGLVHYLRKYGIRHSYFYYGILQQCAETRWLGKLKNVFWNSYCQRKSFQ